MLEPVCPVSRSLLLPHVYLVLHFYTSYFVPFTFETSVKQGKTKREALTSIWRKGRRNSLPRVWRHVLPRSLKTGA